MWLALLLMVGRVRLSVVSSTSYGRESEAVCS